MSSKATLDPVLGKDAKQVKPETLNPEPKTLVIISLDLHVV